MTTSPQPLPGANQTAIPADAYWTRLLGGGQSWIYLVRPPEAKDPKIYGAKQL